MKVTTEKLAKNQVMLEIEVANEQFSKALNITYKKIANQVNVPGFRKGKAPRVMLDRYAGKEAIQQEAIEAIFPAVYEEAVKQAEISPVAQPEIENIQAETGQPLVLKIKVVVKPEVALGQYTGFDINRPSDEVSAEDIQKELEQMQNSHAKLIAVEEGVLQNGDTAIIDFTGYIDGTAFENGQAENFSLVIGSGNFIPGFEEQLLELKLGAEKEVKVTFPQEYHVKKLAGQQAVFKVKLNEIKRRELTVLDDEFAKDVSEFDTLEELKTSISNKLKEIKKSQAETTINREVVEKAVAKATLEIPEQMIETQLDEMIKGMEHKLRMQGVELEQYLKQINSNVNDMRLQMREDAETILRQELVLNAIAKAENLTVTDEEIASEIAMMAPQFKQEPAELKLTLEAVGDLKMVKQDILKRKTVAFLREKSTVL
ncbi:MAG: trigger factor [Desulfotomaculum sp.]|nr:trigger factor [Desulfotomaculum sp.]